MAAPNPRVLLLYPPNQNLPGTVCKPNGSLAYPSLAGALRRHGTDVAIFDACVGNDRDDLDVFYRSSTELPSGLLRTGVSDERILEEVAGYDIVGLTSIFTQQETMVLNAARLIREHFPEKILISGGVNARSRLPQFFAAGFKVVCLSESEDTITEIVDAVRRSKTPDFSTINGVATMHDGRIRVNPVKSTDIQWDLDSMPMPAWDLLPNKRYWKIRRPFGGDFDHVYDEVRYGQLMTSIGCPFHCAYCHISGEQEGDISGPIGKYRMKSDDRVLLELETLKGLGVETVFISDDSLLANKKRALRLLDKIRGSNLDILDVNGVNIIHLLKKWKPDHEMLQALVEAGFIDISLPFETGNLRVMRKYATNKLNIEQADIKALIAACKDYGLRIAGHYMLGYPDETLAEVETTINMAKDHVSYGLDATNFFLVMPLPGTTLYDMAIAGGHIDPDFEPDTMNWTKANMKNTVVPAAQLEELRDRAWLETNSAEFKAYKEGMWFPPKVEAAAG